MKDGRKFAIGLIVFITLAVLLCLSIDFAFAKGVEEENATQQVNQSSSALSGWFSVIWGDEKHGKSSTRYTLTDVNGKETRLEIDDYIAKKLGGVLQFNGKYVSVQGVAVPSPTGAITNSMERTSPVVNVTSISLAPPPGSHAPTASGLAVAAAVTGSRPWVTIMCQFSDISAQPKDRAFFVGMYGDAKPGLNHYWKELSFNTADITGSDAATGWYVLPHPESYYNPTDSPQSANLGALADDCIAAADGDIDFSLFSGINMMFNSDFDNGWAWGGSIWKTLDGVTKNWSATWEPPDGYRNISIIAHEMGHGFGLPHSSYDRAAVYDNSWDVMSQDRYNCDAATDPTYGCMAQHTISYHKDLLGWIPGPRAITVPGPVSTTTLTLEDLASPASVNYQIAKIPIGGSATNFYTLEARRFTGYDSKLPGEAVIIHNIDTTNGTPALHVPGGYTSEDPATRFTVGEKFVDSTNDIAVAVNRADSSGFEVTIYNGTNMPVSEAGGPYVAECQGPTTTISLTGAGTAGSNGGNLSYSWTTTCPATFGDAKIANPALTLNSGTCPLNCEVSLTVTNSGGFYSTDSATITVQDTVGPAISCNHSATITPSSAPIVFTATAKDICSTPSVKITDYQCMGRKKSRNSSCIVTLSGDQIMISDSGGVGNTISWTVQSTDASGIVMTKVCSVKVVNAKK